MSIPRKGFTLAEALLGMVILTFALVSVLALFANCVILNESNRNLTIAVSHAQFVMEEIKNTKFANISSGDWDWDPTQIATKGLSALTNELITTMISLETDDLLDDLWDVAVSVEWYDRKRKHPPIILRTLIAEP